MVNDDGRSIEGCRTTPRPRRVTGQESIDVANSMKVHGDVERPLLPGYENQ